MQQATSYNLPGPLNEFMSKYGFRLFYACILVALFFTIVGAFLMNYYENPLADLLCNLATPAWIIATLLWYLGPPRPLHLSLYYPIQGYINLDKMIIGIVFWILAWTLHWRGYADGRNINDCAAAIFFYSLSYLPKSLQENPPKMKKKS
jgi:hypothetical protein